jgi:hypothetical protein
MLKIKSKLNPEVILSVQYAFSESELPRALISESSDSLQVMAMNLPAGKKVVAHSHDNAKPKTIENTQECWIVLDGGVNVTIYDIDDTELQSLYLKTGDVYLTIKGGHSLEVLKDTKLIEVKNGPYDGSPYRIINVKN